LLDHDHPGGLLNLPALMLGILVLFTASAIFRFFRMRFGRKD